MSNWSVWVVKSLPKRLVSRVVGWLVRLERPRLLARAAVACFARAFRIDLSEAQVPDGGFPCISALFTRTLKPSARPVASGEEMMVAPVDGVLREHGPAVGHQWTVKGLDMTLEELLGGDPLIPRLKTGEVYHFYLSPPDYHHIHSPVEGTIVKSVYIPGTLWPVNEWAVNRIRGLFSFNERLVTWIESPFGLVAVVMVGALNVGRMTVTYDSWLTNSGRLPDEPVRVYVPGKRIGRGERIGTFHMGSSVVLVLEKRPPGALALTPLQGPSRVGQALWR